MHKQDHLSIFEENIKALEESLRWLVRSYNIQNLSGKVDDAAGVVPAGAGD